MFTRIDNIQKIYIPGRKKMIKTLKKQSRNISENHWQRKKLVFVNDSLNVENILISGISNFKSTFRNHG